MGCINTSSTQQPRNKKNHLPIADTIKKVNNSPPVQSDHPLTANLPSNNQVYLSQNQNSPIPVIPASDNSIQRFSHRQRVNIQQPQILNRLPQQQTQNRNFHAQQGAPRNRVIAQEAPIQAIQAREQAQPLQIIHQQSEVRSVRQTSENQRQNEEGEQGEEESQNPEQFESLMIGPFLIISIGQSNFVLVVRNNQNRINGLSQQQINHLNICEAPNSEVTCSICQQQIKKQQKIIILTCSHQFHETCLIPWLKNSDNCPMCRKSVRNN